ncbi:antibiotic ABC transporter [Paracoccus aurantiacus]|uniref:Antibiotic ABC transporter n=1 Tax=Paracoccus aurantiacus TaxID=2599412 RepID=A0A5C6SBR7_9RHOB|nr:antibiotic ABC transporter [Paracoccus aurantiacus]TXB71263.1 antibiotic ABC transporter [Paracoccus aurantiacus]
MGFLPNNMAEATRLWVQVAQIAIESQMVIGMRLAGMMGFLPQHKNESHRMVQEKFDAAQEAGSAMMTAMTRGASPDQVMAAALRPYGRRTKANARRLTRASVKRGS